MRDTVTILAVVLRAWSRQVGLSGIMPTVQSPHNPHSACTAARMPQLCLFVNWDRHGDRLVAASGRYSALPTGEGGGNTWVWAYGCSTYRPDIVPGPKPLRDRDPLCRKIRRCCPLTPSLRQKLCPHCACYPPLPRVESLEDRQLVATKQMRDTVAAAELCRVTGGHVPV